MFKKALSGLLSLAMILTMIVSAPMVVMAEEPNVFVDFENYNLDQYPSIFSSFSSGLGTSAQKVMEVDYGSTKTKAFRIISGVGNPSTHFMNLDDEDVNNLVISLNVKPLVQDNPIGEISLKRDLNSSALLPKLIFDDEKIYALDKDESNDLKLIGDFQKDKWYSIILSINLNTDIYSVYVDGVLKGDGLTFDNIIPDKLFLMTYAGANNEMYFDNIGLYNSVNDIPQLKEVKISGSFTAKDKVFDGSKNAEFATNNLVLTGVDPLHDDVSLDVVKIEFATSNVGINIPVNIVSATLKGSDALKYKISLEGAPTDLATITPANHLVTYNVNGGNGTLTAKLNNNTIPSGTLVQTHNTVVFTATPNTGYKVKEWVINNEVFNSTVLIHTLENIRENTNVVVVFEPILSPVNKYRVAFDVTGGKGTITAYVGGLLIQSPYMVEKGQNLVFMANQETGYKVKEWLVNGVKQTTDNPNVLIIQNLDKNINVRLVLTGGITPVPDEDEDSYPAAPSIANRILKQYNISNRYIMGRLPNNKAKYGNFISEIARETKGSSFRGISKFNKVEYYNAVYQFLKAKGADLP